LSETQALFKRDAEAWRAVYDAGKADLLFLSDKDGAQWNATDFIQRRKSGKPTLTLDKLGQFTRQVANSIRMNTPSINILPSDDKATIDTAMMLKGHIRSIEYDSDADTAYDTAALSSVRASIGFIRVDHDYIDNGSFDQQLQIKRVVNTFNTYIDSKSIEIDGRDAKHAFCTETMSMDEFKRKYPKAEPIGFDEADKDADHDSKEEILIVEYFKLEEVTKDLALYEGYTEPVIEDSSKVDKRTDEAKVRRKITNIVVKRYKLSGKDILEEGIFPGRYIPIVPVYGEEMWLDGKRHLFSLTRKAQSSQQLHNYLKSIEIETLIKMPQTPWLAVEGTTEEYKDEWLNPGTSGVLRHKQTDVDGNPAPRPERITPPTIPTGLFNAAQSSVDDIKSAMGLFNASLGQQGNETSGLAIQRRNQQGEVGTFHFSDNLTKSITHIGRILIGAIPEILDTPRTITIVGEDDSTTKVGINGMMEDSQKSHHDLTKGRYNVRVSTGDSFLTLRQEANDFFKQIVSTQPDFLQTAGDLIFKNMDIPGADALAKRMEKLLPPGLKETEDGQPEQNPEVMQLQAQLQQIQQEAQQLQGQLESKQQDLQVKLQIEAGKTEIEKGKLALEAKKLQILEQDKIEQQRLKQEEIDLKHLDITSGINLEQEKIDNEANKEIATQQSSANNGDVNNGVI